MAIDAAEQIEKFQEFIEQSYQKQLHENMSKGLNFLLIDFFDLTKYDPKLADQLLEEPEETIKAAEMALEQFEVKKGFRIRFRNLSKSQEIFIRNLRSKHLSKFISMEGIIRQSSEVRPQAVSAKFECPSCGNTITMPQLDMNFREPSRCSCGRKGKFRLLSKELVDVQRLVIEESPENLEGGAQPKRMQIFLKEDLVEPRMERRTTPGVRILVNGVMYEVPIQTKTGSTSTRFDLAMNANYLEPLAEDYSEIVVSPEDEKEIKKLAKDKNVYKRLVASISHTIYGYDKIKEAILLQMFGGIRKTKKDGTIVRGDLHVLLVGDPGCIAGDSKIALHNNGMRNIKSLGSYHGEKIHETVIKIRKNGQDKGYDFATEFQIYPQQPVLKLVTETGKSVVCTFNQPFFTGSGWKRADEILLGTKIRVMPKIPNYVKNYVKTNFCNVEKKSGKLKEIVLPEFYTPELAALCGYIIGDGHLHKKGYRTVCYINNNEKDLIPVISNLWLNTFSVTSSSFVREGEKIKNIDDGNGMIRQFVSKEVMHIVEVNSRQVASSLSFLTSKRVPQEIFQSPKNVVASFLKWLFEADGCAFGKGRGRTAIQLKSRTKSLLEDVQLLLLFFGIHSRIVEDNLCIRRAYDMELYANNIGFVSKKKRIALQEVLSVTSNRTQRRKANQRWEQVVKIDFEGFKDVYDFEVPKSHSFIANGILCHNSGKSQMLTFVAKAAPKARYVAGRSASGAGLCVSPNSWVMTNPGGISRIQDIVDERLKNNFEFRPGVWKEENISDVNIQSMSNKLKVHSKKPSGIWKLEAPRKMFKVTLSSGKQIELTGNTSLFTIENGFTSWKKSMDLKIGEYVATPRTLIGGDIDNKHILDFVKSNPVVHNVKPFVKEIAKKLVEKYGSLREACKYLNISENQLYHLWVNDSAIGNIKLKDLIRISEEVGLDYHDKVVKVSLYNGKNHNLPLILDEDILYFTGLVAGGGYIRKNNYTYEIGFSNSLEGLHLEFQEVLKNKFNLHFYSSEGNKVRSKQTRCSSKILGEILLGLGLVISPKSNKIYLSEDLLHMKNNFLAHYIAGLYDTDGLVNIRNGKGSSCIDLTTCSEKLAKQLQIVLLRYNIHASLRVRNPSVNPKIVGKHKKYILEIRNLDNFKRFYEFIPLRNKNKKERLEFILRTKTKSNTNIDIVPGISIRLKELLQKNNYSLRKYGWHENFSRRGLIKILDKVRGSDFEELRVLAKSDIFWEKIIFIDLIDSPYDYVYDLTIEDSHNFVVDGVLVHNTCSVVKDEFLRGWALEAGAMVLADKGILVLDEMDKISKEDTSALHEAMEQQQISVAKANIQATLRTQTSILAAANPKLGRFDPFAPIPNQIDLPPALINRFDLIFIMRDLPNKELDANIATKVLQSHAYKDVEADIKPDFLRKYLAYTKQKIFPTLTDEAVEVIKKFYVDLRASGSLGDSAIKPIPISARQLEAVVRLAEASARIKLKDKVEEEDAIRAINLLKGCLNEVGIDPDTGKIDIDRMTTGISASARGATVNVREILYALSDEKEGGPINIEEDLKPKVFEKGITEKKLEEAIDLLKRGGDFYEPKHGWLQKV